MSRTYNRRAAIAKRKRNEAIQETATTVLLVAGALLATIATIGLGVALGLLFAGSI